MLGKASEVWRLYFLLLWLGTLVTRMTLWLQFDMGVEVTVWGLLLKKRSDSPFQDRKVLSCDVTFSHDGDAWMTAEENLVSSYPDGISSVVWLHYPVSSRYWRINPLTWVGSIPL